MQARRLFDLMPVAAGNQQGFGGGGDSFGFGRLDLMSSKYGAAGLSKAVASVSQMP